MHGASTLTVIDTVAVVEPVTFEAVTVNVMNALGAAGVPLITPVTGSIASPAGSDGLIAMALIKAPNVLVAAAVLAFVDLPGIDCWPYLLGSIVTSTFYFYFLINAYRMGDLGVAYPVSRSIAPLLVMGISLGALAFCARSILPAIIAHATADTIIFVGSVAEIGPSYVAPSTGRA